MSSKAQDGLVAEKAKAGELFNRIYRQYDLLNHIMSFRLDFRWRNILARKMKRDFSGVDNPVILDLAAGTGDLTIAVSKRIPQAQIVCADISENMMDLAKVKMQKRNLLNATFSFADAAELPFENNSMDAVMIAFGIRNFPRLDESFKECFRVLKNGGRLYILEFGWPGNLIVSSLYTLFSVTLIPLLGRIIAGDAAAYNYLRKTIRTFPYGASLTERMQKTGLEGTSYRKLSGGIVYFYEASKNIHSQGN